ncbi:MAG: DUF2975 domain-containing protein [Ignavibacteriales bacterium]|nr:DUF2975 domain-containing protein [Ignavibacteriales bacterium]
MKEKKKTGTAVVSAYSLLSIFFGGLIAITLLQIGLFLLGIFSPGRFLPTFPNGMEVTLNPNEVEVWTDQSSKYSVFGIEGILTVYEPNMPVFICSNLIPISVYASLLVIVFLIRKIIGTINRGSPFTVKNGNRIRIISMLIIFVPLFVVLLRYIIKLSLPADLTINGMGIAMHAFRFDFISTLTLGLIVMAIGEVFVAGAKLKEENGLMV